MSLIHLKYLGEALFPTNIHHSMIVKDTDNKKNDRKN